MEDVSPSVSMCHCHSHRHSHSFLAVFFGKFLLQNLLTESSESGSVRVGNMLDCGNRGCGFKPQCIHTHVALHFVPIFLKFYPSSLQFPPIFSKVQKFYVNFFPNAFINPPFLPIFLHFSPSSPISPHFPPYFSISPHFSHFSHFSELGKPHSVHW